MTARAPRSLRLAVLVAVVAAWTAAAAQPALAHIQVRPTEVAPGDSVLFELLVPGERDTRTVEVALQVPRGVLPFSFENTPGWRRKVELANDGSIDVVRWRGRLDTDGFVRFAFLAGTPEREGEIEWKALQTYDDGQEARWIGPPDSENPAAVTNVTSSAARENAGGEGASASGEDAGPAEEEATAAPTVQPPADTQTSSGDDGNTVAVVLGAAGVILGAAALAVALAGRRRPHQPALRQDPR